MHISTYTNISAFIPFCSFGSNLIGEKLGNFKGPVCDQFREKIVNGQICFEADMNQYKEGSENWEKALRDGFSFIVDTNEEYDVKNLMIKKTSGASEDERSYPSTIFKKAEKGDGFRILLKTISKSSSLLTNQIYFLFTDPVPVVLHGEGHYGLSDIKEIEVSEDFVGLGEKLTQCKTEEYREDCLSRMYRERVLSKCNCSPFYLISYYGNEVKPNTEMFDIKKIL